MVSYRKKHGITQSDVAHTMLISQPAVARLEQRLSNGADVTLSVLERYAAAVGLAIEWTLNPLKPRYGIFRNAQDAVAFAVHSSACEGLETPQSDIENLKRGGAMKYIKFMKDVRRIKRQFENERKEAK